MVKPIELAAFAGGIAMFFAAKWMFPEVMVGKVHANRVAEYELSQSERKIFDAIIKGERIALHLAGDPDAKKIVYDDRIVKKAACTAKRVAVTDAFHPVAVSYLAYPYLYETDSDYEHLVARFSVDLKEASRFPDAIADAFSACVPVCKDGACTHDTGV
jgi:hypothetical protein